MTATLKSSLLLLALASTLASEAREKPEDSADDTWKKEDIQGLKTENFLQKHKSIHVVFYFHLFCDTDYELEYKVKREFTEDEKKLLDIDYNVYKDYWVEAMNGNLPYLPRKFTSFVWGEYGEQSLELAEKVEEVCLKHYGASIESLHEDEEVLKKFLVKLILHNDINRKIMLLNQLTEDERLFYEEWSSLRIKRMFTTSDLSELKQQVSWQRKNVKKIKLLADKATLLSGRTIE